MLDRSTLQRLYRYGYSLTHDEDAAYDLLQDAVEVCLRRAPRSIDSAASYVRSIMRNRFIDQYRREKRHPSISLDDDNNSTLGIDPRILEDIVIAEHDVETIMTMLEPLEREILFFWAIEGYSAQEIADQLGSPRGTILSRIYRLRRKILDLLDSDRSSGAGEVSS